MLVTSLFVIARNWKQPKYPPARRMDIEIVGWPNKQIQLSTDTCSAKNKSQHDCAE